MCPGGLPPAECELIERIAALAPDVRFHAAFDLDPADIRIARLVQARTGEEMNVDAMNPALLAAGMPGLELSDWDREQLRNLDGRAGPLESLRLAIREAGRKIEQETVQRQILAIFKRLAPVPAPKLPRTIFDLEKRGEADSGAAASHPAGE